MTKNQLIRLYFKLKNNNLDVQLLNDFKDLSNYEIDLLVNSNVPKFIIELISLPETREHIKLACNEKKKIITIISKAKGYDQAKEAFEMMLFTESLAYYPYSRKNNVSEFERVITAISNANGNLQAYCAAKYAKELVSEQCYEQPLLDVIDILASSSEELHAIYGYLVSIELMHKIDNEKLVELVKNITKTNQEEMLKSILNLVQNKTVLALNLESELLLKLLELLEQDNKELIDQITSIISNIDNSQVDEYVNYPYINQLMILFYQEQIINFWTEFQKNPDIAIKSLSEDKSISLSSDITDCTLVRMKTKKKNNI